MSIFVYFYSSPMSSAACAVSYFAFHVTLPLFVPLALLSFPPAAPTSTCVVFLPVSSYCSFVVPPGWLIPVRPDVISSVILRCFLRGSLLLGAAPPASLALGCPWYGVLRLGSAPAAGLGNSGSRRGSGVGGAPPAPVGSGSQRPVALWRVDMCWATSPGVRSGIVCRLEQ